LGLAFFLSFAVASPQGSRFIHHSLSSRCLGARGRRWRVLCRYQPCLPADNDIRFELPSRAPLSVERFPSHYGANCTCCPGQQP